MLVARHVEAAPNPQGRLLRLLIVSFVVSAVAATTGGRILPVLGPDGAPALLPGMALFLAGFALDLKLHLLLPRAAIPFQGNAERE